MNPELWDKATKVYQGIHRLFWRCKYYYVYKTVEDELNEYGGLETYLNQYNKFAVKLDDGTEYALIQPCPRLIYELYAAKDKAEKGDTSPETMRKANAFDKFEPFFKWMINYV